MCFDLCPDHSCCNYNPVEEDIERSVCVPSAVVTVMFDILHLLEAKKNKKETVCNKVQMKEG